MPDFDILGGQGLYDGLVNGGGSSGFDIVAPNAGGRPMPGQGQNGAMPNGMQNTAMQPGGQPQGAPVSGLLAGILGLPTYNGATPGASYLTPQQAQPNAGQGMQPGQAQQLLQLLQMGGLPAGGAPNAVQPQNNIGSAVGSGLRSLFDGVVGSGR